MRYLYDLTDSCCYSSRLRTEFICEFMLMLCDACVKIKEKFGNIWL